MKKLFLSVTIILISLSAFSQQKKDTTIVITFTYADYKKLIYSIHANIDSKTKTNEIIAWMDARTVMIPPKQDTLTNKQLPKK